MCSYSAGVALSSLEPMPNPKIDLLRRTISSLFLFLTLLLNLFRGLLILEPTPKLVIITKLYFISIGPSQQIRNNEDLRRFDKWFMPTSTESPDKGVLMRGFPTLFGEKSSIVIIN